MSTAFTRREMLRGSAVAALVARAAPAADATSNMTHVFLRLRGGADGLSLIVPYREQGYYRARPTTALEVPGKGPQSAVIVDEPFALHPCLASWKGLFDAREMAAVVGVGLPSRIASHRLAQHALDAAIVSASGDPAPLVLGGALGEQLRRVAAALAGAAPRTVLVESLGWDTHTAQGRGTQGRLAERVRELGAALLEFRAAVAGYRERVRLAIVTEFGRTLSESVSQGTDDGYASVLFTFGARESGRVHGEYGYLEPAGTCQERSRPPALSIETLLSRFVHGETLL